MINQKEVANRVSNVLQLYNSDKNVISIQKQMFCSNLNRALVIGKKKMSHWVSDPKDFFLTKVFPPRNDRVDFIITPFEATVEFLGVKTVVDF